MGRRRIGKTRLIEEFGKSIKTFTFTGLPPDGKVTADIERDHFARQLQEQIGGIGVRSDDWDNLLWQLAQHVHKGRILVVFDEINWMSTKDPSFLGKLKTVWDTHFKKNSKLMMILSGSMSGWIEKNILKSTGFFGRVSLDMTLEELPLFECNHFWENQTELISPYEKFKILAVTGGIPRYLEEVNPKISSEENIRQLCFRREGLLFKEYDRICTELFAKRAPTYENILSCLGEGAAQLANIFDFLGVKKSGTLSEYLDDLEKMGYVARDNSWHTKDGKISPVSMYRLKDNYSRFQNLYICEIKFQKGPIKKTIIDEVDIKMKNLKTPKGFSKRAVLIHVNGVDDSVIESNYFAKIIDFSELLSTEVF